MREITLTAGAQDRIPAGSIAGMGPDTIEALRSEDPQGLARALVFLAQTWIGIGGSHIRARHAISATAFATGGIGDRQQKTPEQRAFLAAGCDLYDVLAASPLGHKALSDLILQPVAKDTDRDAIMNWQTILSELLAHGWTQVRLAAELGRPQSWVSDVKRGVYADLRWSDGEHLRKLHEQIANSAPSDAPHA